MTTELRISKGYITTIDDEMMGILFSIPWFYHPNGYVISTHSTQIKLKRYRTTTYLHRLVYKHFTGENIDSIYISHKDYNTLNNTIENLIVLDKSMIGSRKKVHINSQTGVKGVYYRHKIDRFQATITVNGKEIYIGCYKTIREAALEYNKAALFYFGEYARLNDVE